MIDYSQSSELFSANDHAELSIIAIFDRIITHGRLGRDFFKVGGGRLREYGR